MKHFIKYSAALCAALGLLVLAACTDIMNSPPAKQARSGIEIIINSVGADSRTLLPDTTFIRYEINFSPLGSQEPHLPVDVAGNETSAKIEDLEDGLWYISVYGFVNTSREEQVAAFGSDTINVGGGTFNQTAPITVSPSMNASDPVGLFNYTVNFPEGLADDATLWVYNVGAAFSSGDDYNVYAADDRKDIIDLAPGYYMVTIVLNTPHGDAFRTEVVHIYSGMETTGEFNFIATDFPKTINLSGTANITVNEGTAANVVIEASYNGYSLGSASVTRDPDGEGYLWDWTMALPAFETDTTLDLTITAIASNSEVFYGYETLTVSDTNFTAPTVVLNQKKINVGGNIVIDNAEPNSFTITATLASSGVVLGTTSGANTFDWSMRLPAYDTPTTVNFTATGISGTGLHFTEMVPAPVADEDISNIEIRSTIPTITLSGTATITIDSYTPQNAWVYAYDESNMEIGSSAVNLNNGNWSITIGASNDDFTVTFQTRATTCYNPTEIINNGVATRTVSNTSMNNINFTSSMMSISLTGTLSVDNWYDGTAGGGTQWFAVPVTPNQQYWFWTNTNPSIGGSGNGTKTGNVTVVGYQPDNTQVIANNPTWDTPVITSSQSNVIFIRVTGTTAGSYGIVYSNSSDRPSPFDVPANVIPLYDGVWNTSGNLRAGTTEQWYSIDVTSGYTYRVWWDDSFEGSGTYSSDVVVGAVYDDGATAFGSIAPNSTAIDNGYTTPGQFTANKSGTLYIRVGVYSGGTSYGTYAITYTENNPMRPWTFTWPPAATSLSTEDKWTDGTITANEEQWYSFTATGDTYIWWDSNGGSDNYNGNVAVSAVSAGGTTYIFGDPPVNNGYTTSQLAATTGTVYIRVRGQSAGSFSIVYSASTERPVNLATYPSLINSTWTQGSFTANGDEQWYSIDVTSGTYYFWTDDGTAGAGTKTGNIGISFYHEDDINTSIVPIINGAFIDSTSVTFSNGGKVGVKVTANDGGTYAIAYNTTDTRPTPLSRTLLGDDVFFNDEIGTDESGERWYSFSTSTGITYSIWWDDDNASAENKNAVITVTVMRQDGTSIEDDATDGYDTPVDVPGDNNSVYIKVTGSTAGTFAIGYTEDNAFTPPSTYQDF